MAFHSDYEGLYDICGCLCDKDVQDQRMLVLNPDDDDLHPNGDQFKMQGGPVWKSLAVRGSAGGCDVDTSRAA